MKIEESSVTLRSSHEQHYEREISREQSTTFREIYTDVRASEVGADESPANGAPASRTLAQLIERMLELLFGSGQGSKALRDLAAATASNRDPAGRSARGQLSVDWTMRKVTTVSESESTQFSARGVVRTADGYSLAFGLGLDLNRADIYASEEIRTGTVVLRDPLVVNFDGKACELSGRRFSFDLDADGQLESLPGLASSSGFLALDRNADGRITDGSELFGARSGDGFADLAAQDSDGNGWIDESDPLFDRLCVWEQDARGDDQTMSLRAAGIGAIYLGSVSTAFNLTDETHAVLAQIRASGVYLRDDGSAGVIQQVDLSTQPGEVPPDTTTPALR